MKFLLAAGGSGGHIYPGLAILQGIKEIDPEATFLWVGTHTGSEGRIAKENGIPFTPIRAWSVNNEGLLWKLQAYWFHGLMTLKIMNLLRKEQVDAVITTGGYVSASTLMAASLMKKPIFMHEQNVFPGMGTRTFAKHVKKIYTSFPGTENYLPGQEDKILLMGNPIRDEFFTLNREKIRKEMELQGKTLVLSLGGSLGAKSLNDFILSLKSIIEGREDLHWVHVLGEAQGESIKDFQGIKNLEAHLYLDDLPSYMVASDVMITRSGAGMLTELSALGRASILIPSPNVVDDHQSFNAKLFQEQGGAFLLEDRQLSESFAKDMVLRLLDDEELRHGLAQRSKGIVPDQAAKNIARDILESL